MENLLQGTTPYLVIDFTDTGLDVSDLTAAELTLKSGFTKLTYALPSMTVDTSANTLTYHFTENDTLTLSTTAAVTWQVFVKFGGEIYGTEAERVNIFRKEKEEAME